MNPFKGRHFQRDIILWAVRWYCKYGISYRELQEMLAERLLTAKVRSRFFPFLQWNIHSDDFHLKNRGRKMMNRTLCARFDTTSH